MAYAWGMTTVTRPAAATATVGSLFSGIGGLELGAESALRAAGMDPRVLWQVEREAFCRGVLARHWPDADRTVTDVCADGALLLPRVDIIVGGPPCQDISGAGKREGLHGERSGLLFRYLQIVRALRPSLVIAENVRSGAWRSWLGVASCGLRSAGYRVDAVEIHAADVGAPHQRARIFVVAYAPGERFDARDRREREEGRGAVVDLGGEHVGHAECAGREGTERPCTTRIASPSRSAYDAGQPQPDAESLMARSANGLPAGLDIPRRWPAGRGEEQQGWEPPRTVGRGQPQRRARVKALGNAVVPAVAERAMVWALGLRRQE